MPGTDEVTPGERRELKALVKGQFKVLRAEVARRAQELEGEIEAEFLRQYRAQDDAIAEAKRAEVRAYSDCRLALEKIAEDLKFERPELTVTSEQHGRLGLSASDPNRSQARRAALAAVPAQIGDAKLRLDRGEMDTLKDLAIGALRTDQAIAFLDTIPTVGDLIPQVRLAELERSLMDGES